jgi:hypothetical protein
MFAMTISIKITNLLFNSITPTLNLVLFATSIEPSQPAHPCNLTSFYTFVHLVLKSFKIHMDLSKFKAGQIHVINSPG